MLEFTLLLLLLVCGLDDLSGVPGLVAFGPSSADLSKSLASFANPAMFGSLGVSSSDESWWLPEWGIPSKSLSS